jgi:hypothetical protein
MRETDRERSTINDWAAVSVSLVCVVQRFDVEWIRAELLDEARHARIAARLVTHGVPPFRL